jgi:Leucine-rich repeat (LRR) protein
MGASNDLAPWASDIQSKNGKLEVTLRRGLDANGVASLLKTQDVSSVRGLKLPGSIGLSGLRALLLSKRFKTITSISLSGFTDPDDAVDVVFEAQAMTKLRVLKIWGVSDAIDTRLARGDFVKALRQLEIRNSPELTSLDRFFASKRVEFLHYLTINGSGLADASTLFDNPSLLNLRGLSLAKCALDADSFGSLGLCKRLSTLKKLNLSYNGAEEEVAVAIQKLLRSNSLENLEQLMLCGCELEGFDWERVKFPNLRKLDLRDNTLEFDELLEILSSAGLPKLTQLIVSSPEGAVPNRYDKRITIDDRRPPWA